MTKQSLASSFKNAAKGILVTSKERNFRIEFCFLILASVLGLFYQIPVYEWAIIFTCCGMVLGGECLNSALEALVDLVSPNYHELAGKAKDCAAGAVLVASIFSFFVGAILFLPRILGTLGIM